MNPMQEAVYDFHYATNSTTRDVPELTDPELRAKLIMEEAVETVAAMGFYADAYISHVNPNPEDPWVIEVAEFHKGYDEPNFPDAIDGLADLLYVIFGSAVAWGIDLEPFFNEVHRANMAKLSGPKREDGKQLKPEGWQPPAIQEELDEQLRKAEAWTAITQVTLPFTEVITAETRHERLLNGEGV